MSVFNFHLQVVLTPGGLVQMWHCLAEILQSWYEEIREEIVLAGVLYADETGCYRCLNPAPMGPAWEGDRGLHVFDR